MVFLIVCAVILTAVILICLYIYCVAFYAPKKKRYSADAPLEGEQYEAVAEHIFRISHIMERIPCEDVTIHSFDGCRLHGRYYHVRDGAPLEILFHGYRSCAFRDCSGGHALSRKMGFNALVVDQRAHGNSDGVTITFGIKEHRDCLCWIEYANQRFGTDTPIILSGLSMGAATVLMATGLELPENVTCVLADSPYSTPQRDH
jgi:predicted alpha/beta-fold hydrolase